MSAKCYSVMGDGTTLKAKKKYIVNENGLTQKIKKKYIVAPSFIPRDLPEGYTQVEYIESTGTQYIDTGFVPNQDTRVIADFQFTTTPTAHWGVFGARTTQSAGFFVFGYNSTAFRTDYNATKTFFSTAIGATERLVVDKNKNVTTLNGETITETAGTFSAGCNLYISTINTSGDLGTNTGSLRLWSMQIYDNGTLIRDYVPCKNPEGVAGLYDLENDTFTASASGTAFVTGPTESYPLTRLVYEEIPVFKSYSGTYEVTQVTGTDGALYDLYKFTGSGTLVLNEEARYWMNGGGGSGSNRGGNGGGGGYIKTGTLAAGTHIVTIGSGGYGNTDLSGSSYVGSDGGNTTIVTNGTTTASAAGGKCTGDGASGGGQGGYTGDAGTGEAASGEAYPFGITSLEAHSAGGGAGGYYSQSGSIISSSTRYDGGAGGTDGSDGGVRIKPTTYDADGGKGGTKGGGSGGRCSGEGSNSIYAASSATFYGSGGGGGAYAKNSTASAARGGGSGYQGIMYLLVPAA